MADSSLLIIKTLWMVHLTMSSWAMFSGFIAVSTYVYTHIAMLGVGLWSIVDSSSVDAIELFLATVGVSVINDVVVLSLYLSRGITKFEDDYSMSTDGRNEFRFAATMCFLNLMMKPFTLYLLYRIYRSRADGTELSAGFDGFGRNYNAVGKGYPPGAENSYVEVLPEPASNQNYQQGYQQGYQQDGGDGPHQPSPNPTKPQPPDLPPRDIGPDGRFISRSA